MTGRVEIAELYSDLLVDNPLEDTPQRRVPVYLPAGYDEGDTDYPVLYALAGFTGSGLSFLNYDWYQEDLPRRLDRLIGSGAMDACIVVMVDGMTRIGGNQYIDSTAVGPWASHIIQELVPWAERTYRILPGREHRGVFGKSSGGYGALMMAMEHSDVFAAAVSHSGDSYFDYCYGPDFPKAADGLRSVGGLGNFLAGLREYDKFPSKLFHTLNVVAMTHFYSPNPEAEHGIDLPFDEVTGERREDVFARWRERDPVNLVGRNAAAMMNLKFLWVECGSNDEWNLHHGARILSARLRESGVPHHHEEFEDDHRNLNYRYDVTLPKLAEAVR